MQSYNENNEFNGEVPQTPVLEADAGGLTTSGAHEEHEKRTQFTSEGRTQTNPARPRRINPDSHRMLWFVVVCVGFVGCISFMVSFAGLVAVAEWAGLPSGMRWTVPVFIDTAILVYSMAVLIHRSRGEETWASWLSLTAFTVVSFLANVGHVVLESADLGSYKTWIGALVAGMAPVGVFAATEELGRLAIARPGSVRDMSDELVQVGEDRPNTTPPEPGTKKATLPQLTKNQPVEDTSDTVADTQDDTSDTVSEELVGASNMSDIPADTAPEKPVEPLFAQVTTVDTVVSDKNDSVSEEVVEPVADESSSVDKDPATWDMVSVPKPLSDVLSGPIPAVSPVRDTTPPPVETVSEPVQVSEAIEPDRSMRVIRSLDPVEEEDRILENLLVEHGSSLTAKMIADALGKVPRTGQRKLTALKKKHPEVFGSSEETKEA